MTAMKRIKYLGIYLPKEIQPDHSKGGQPWVFFGRNDAKAETPVLWPPHVSSFFLLPCQMSEKQVVMSNDYNFQFHRQFRKQMPLHITFKDFFYI